ncbi:MAG: cyclic nucleotide-binding domain-containing protein [Gammaproteobacteria bacterium]|nr:cyclic nucleotide-binding domain-containing protein [Gammaproteobacteria bacterium]
MPSNPILESLPTRLSEEATRFLNDYGRRLQYKTGEVVAREGAACNAVYIVLTGRARIIKNDATGNSNVIAIAEKGSIIGEMGVFMDLKRSASILADGPLTLLELANTDFATALQHFPALSVRMLRSLSVKLNDINQRLVDALQCQHMLYVGMRLLAQQANDGSNGQPLKINLASLGEQAGLQTLDITNALLGFQRLNLIGDVHFADGDHASCRLRTPELRTFLDGGARED